MGKICERNEKMMKKKKNLNAFVVCGVMFVMAPLFAETESVNGDTWTYCINGDTAEISNNYHAAISPAPTGAVTVPSMLGGKPVTSIGMDAFGNCAGMTSVTIPSTVKNIGFRAFYDCDGLTTVTIPDSVLEIEGSAFQGCNNLANVTIGGSVTNIGGGAFAYCVALSEFHVPASVVKLDNVAFYNCSGLMSFSVDSGNTNYSSVDGILCSKDGRTLIAGINGEVTIPQSVVRIAQGAFEGRGGLVRVAIPDSVEEIGRYAFMECGSLMSFSVAPENPNYSSINNLLCSKDGRTVIFGVNGNVTIPNSVTNINDCAFYSYDNLVSVVIPDSVVRIGERAFSNCNRELYDEISIPGVRLVDGWAVGHTDALPSNLNLRGCRGIGGEAFMYCADLANVRIPDSVVTIGDGAFHSCSTLASVIMAESVANIGGYAFCNCPKLVNMTIPDAVTDIAQGTFSLCTGLATVRIGTGVQHIGRYAFNQCSAMKSVVFAGDAPFFDPVAFREIDPACTIYVGQSSSGWDVAIPGVWNGIKIAYWTEGETPYGSDEPVEPIMPAVPYFSVIDGALVLVRMAGETSIILPTNVTSIAASAFESCSDLREIIIPDSVTNIDTEAFYNCTNLERLVVGTGVVKAGFPLTSWMDGNKTIRSGSPSLKEIVIGSPAAYNALFVDVYGNYHNAAYPAVTNVVFAGDAFEAVNGMGSFPALEAVTIPESVNSVGEHAFHGCANLREVVIPDSVEHVGQDAFFGCDALERLVVGSGVESVGAPLFGWRDEDAQQRNYGSQSLKELVVASPQFYDAMFRDEYGYFIDADYPAVTNVVFGWQFEEVPEDVGYVFPALAVSGVEDAFPQIDSGTESEIAASLHDVMKDSHDIGLTNIVDMATYNAFVNWAESVGGNGQSRNQTLAMVKKSSNAWLSFALGVGTLIDNKLSSDDVRIESFSPDVGSGQFIFEVSIAGVDIGSGAVAETVLKENLKKVLGVEGATTLSSDTFSYDNIEITFDAPVDGKARFTVMPPSNAGNSFFMRVKVK